MAGTGDLCNRFKYREASVEFLKEYNCERYYRYNKELLFDNQENEMKEVLGK